MKQGEKGLTMVDMIMAVAVTGLIVSFLGTSIYQMLAVTEYGNDKLTAMHELQNAAHWFSLDGQRASSASAATDLLLTIPDDSSITYSLVGSDLRRADGGTSMILAQNIADVRFAVADRLVTMTIISSPQGRAGVSENGTYQVYLRAAGGGK